MKYLYFPGCSLETSANDYEKSIWSVAYKLGIELEELPDWTCCGSSPAHSEDHLLSTLMSVQNLHKASKISDQIITSCASCYSKLKLANIAINKDKDLKNKINSVLEDVYDGQVKVRHFLDVLVNDYKVENILKKIIRNLTGIKFATYYGCLLSRPREASMFENPENPTMIEDLLRPLGATPVDWSHKTECCGAGFSVTKVDIMKRLTYDILTMAKESGAECIVVACPLCQLNLDLRQKDIETDYKTEFNLPVLYFSQLLGIALGIEKKSLGINELITNPSVIVDR